MPWRRILARALSALVVGTLLLVYVPTSLVGMAISALGAAAVALLAARNAALLATTFLICTLVLELFVRMTSGSALTPYYRPHEMFALEKSYQASRQVEMLVPHGDLLAIDPQLDRALAQPRTVLFRTDTRGYRNDDDFDGSQQLIMVGDSFVVNDSGPQEETLTGRLFAEHGVMAYNLGFQAGPIGYSERIEWARQEFPGERCIVLMMFEGNDFQPADAQVALRVAVPESLQGPVKAYVKAVVRRFELSRTMFGLRTRAAETLAAMFSSEAAERAPPKTLLRHLGEQPIPFLAGYAEVTRRERYDDLGLIFNALESAPPDALFFIPEKYRVYSELIEEREELPHAQWQHLETVARDLGIPAFDLTPAMQRRAAHLLHEGKLVYWLDDTHWNGEGASVAAQAIVSHLRDHPREACRSAVAVPFDQAVVNEQ